MSNMVKALVWENLTKSMGGLIGAFVVLPILWTLASYYLQQFDWMDIGEAGGWDRMIYGIAIMGLTIVFSYQDNSKNDFDLSFPKHVMLLPVPSWTICLVPILIMSAVLCLFTLMWWNFVIQTDWEPRSQFWMCFGMLAMASWIQALIWGFSKSTFQKSLILVATVALTIVALQSVLITNVESSMLGRKLGVLVLIVLIVSGYGLAFYTVSRSRGGKAVSVNFSRALKLDIWYQSTSFYRRSIAAPTFRDEIEAHNWYEWRKFGMMMPALVAFLGLFVLGASFNAKSLEVLAPFIVMMGVMAPLVGPEVASSGIGKYDYKLPQFVQHLPISDFRLAYAKLALMAKSLSISYVIFIVVILASLGISGHYQELGQIIAGAKVLIGSYEVYLLIALAVGLMPIVGWVVATNLVALYIRVAHASKLVKHVYLPFALVSTFFFFMEGLDQLTQKEVIDWVLHNYFLVIAVPVIVVFMGLIVVWRYAYTSIETKVCFSHAMKLLGVWSIISLFTLQMSIDQRWQGLLMVVIGVVLMLSYLPLLTVTSSIRHSRHGYSC